MLYPAPGEHSLTAEDVRKPLPGTGQRLKQDLDALLNFERTAPAGWPAHPRTERFAPLFVTLGAAESDLGSQRIIDGFWMGLAKRSIQLG